MAEWLFMIFIRTYGYGWWLAVALILGGSAVKSRAQSSNVVLFGFTNTWKYNQTSSSDGSNWTARAFDDSTLPSGRGVLGFEDAANTFVTSRTNTVLALGPITYYFRTHFTFTNNLSRLVSMTFSNILDDGAVFYLNGVEISRLFMTNNSTPVSYATLATSHEYFKRAYRVINDDVPAIWLYEPRLASIAHTRLQVSRLRADAWWSGLADWSIPPGQRIARDKVGSGPVAR